MTFTLSSSQRFWGALCAFQAFIAVAAGAFGAHGLKNLVAAQNLEWWHTACQYLMYHAIAGLFVVWASIWRSSFLFSAKLFSLGSVFFAGSLMAMTITDVRVLGAVTPIGGVLYLAGWALVIRSFLKNEQIPVN